MTRVRNTAIAASIIILIDSHFHQIPHSPNIRWEVLAQTSGLQQPPMKAGASRSKSTPQGLAPTEQGCLNPRHHHSSRVALTTTSPKTRLLGPLAGQIHTLKWDGAQREGHHLHRCLNLPVGRKLTTLKLIIRNVYDVPERVVQWNLGSQTGRRSPPIFCTLAPQTSYVLGITVVAVLIAAVLINRRPKKTDASMSRY